uniref:Gamma-tubulin complex component n=1 Tax=Magallana gigas TaxID=29159 RepID=K1PPH0_MAGGI
MLVNNSKQQTHAKREEVGQTKDYLARNAKDRADRSGVSLTSHSKVISQLPAPGTKITMQDFTELKDTLFKESKAMAATTASEILRKALQEKPTKRNVNIPPQPDWLFKRPSLTLDFIVGVDEPSDQNIVPLGSMSVSAQEHAILDDMLNCMQGIEGKYILARALTERYAPKEFMLDQSLDPSLQDLVRRILPLCCNYSTVVRFIEGLHGVGGSAGTPVQTRKSESPENVVLHTAHHENFRHSGISVQFCKQGGMDSKGQDLCLYLTQAACVPYFEILEKWIYKGIISDPYSEFLVEENETINKEKLQEEYNDAYWEGHYTICRERIPVFLEQVANKVLNTGKYLNVVRLCGRDVQCPCAEEIVYTVKERKYYEQIEKAYEYSSKLLLELLVEEKELMARIRSIKHYFLLDKGDFIVQFMDMTEDEMRQDMENITPTRLETLLELALRTSTANTDQFKDDLRVDLLPFDLITQLFKILSIETKKEKEYKVDPTDLHLSGLESFSFDYMVKWPVSLVLNRKALIRYQMLFRHLFYCKHVERQLCSVWIGNKAAKMYSLHSSKWYLAAFALRQRMLNFVQNFEYYMMFEVVEQNWLMFQTNMENVSNIDDVLTYHSDFLNTCMNDCMLTDPDLLRIVHKLMVVCVTFSNFIQRLSLTTAVESENVPTRESSLQATSKEHREQAMKEKLKTKVVAEHVDLMLGSENFERTIANFDNNFSGKLIELLKKIMDLSSESGQFKLLNILYRLDFNGFYKEKLEAMSAERAMMESSMHSTDSGKKKKKKTLSETLVSDCKVFCIVCTPHSLESGKSVGCQEDTVEF